ncbi:hypothetical protein [Herbaspirillum rhizosphaerae]|uniref:hypothetical protein n=1 Tax=Herbaspirillum rhizosphaerae TaxID=346179 RepID=UPI000AC07180|nr:hypothetical protein [Herbaspirillum rhizosphaerae]
MMKEWRHYASPVFVCVVAGAKSTAKKAIFHDAKTSFHNVKNTIAQHHGFISFSEISFRIAKLNN